VCECADEDLFFDYFSSFLYHYIFLSFPSLLCFFSAIPPRVFPSHPFYLYFSHISMEYVFVCPSMCVIQAACAEQSLDLRRRADAAAQARTARNIAAKPNQHSRISEIIFRFITSHYINILSENQPPVYCSCTTLSRQTQSQPPIFDPLLLDCICPISAPLCIRCCAVRRTRRLRCTLSAPMRCVRRWIPCRCVRVCAAACMRMWVVGADICFLCFFAGVCMGYVCMRICVVGQLFVFVTFLLNSTLIAWYFFIIPITFSLRSVSPWLSNPHRRVPVHH
jgi:hypothetical protein